MKISYNWLRDYIDVSISADKLKDILTNLGLEVEGIEEYESIKGGLEGLVVGKVLECEKHPNADKLKVTKVDIGEDTPLNIICGAPNVEVGQKVVVAKIGTKVFINKKEVELEKVKIRGIESEGMICAEDEIGLGNSHEGIIVLDERFEVGKPLKDYFDIYKDIVFEIGITPNRIDAASHFGVARDLAAYLSLKNPIKANLPDVSSFKVDDNSYPIEVVIKNTKACRRYAGVSISGVKIQESPQWLKNRLKAIGLNPINNVVDITNYVLHEMGQPLHAFDADKIAGKKIIVQNVQNGTKLITLDEKERFLTESDLIICDVEKPLCIAGVMGGLESGVTENTINVFLESAYFDPGNIRKTSKHHGLVTDSSFRFERGVNPELTIYALKRAALLIQNIAGGKVSSDIIDVYPVPFIPSVIELHYDYFKKLSGLDIPINTLKNILKSLDFEIKEEHDDFIVLIAPLYRVDVTRPADVVEEVLRIYGYDNVPMPNKFSFSFSYDSFPENEKIIDKISDFISAQGFNEIMCNSLTASSYYKNLKKYPLNRCVKIINPLSSELDVLRQTLLFGGLESIVRNVNRKINNLRFYEFGNVYFFENGDPSNLENYKEELHLGIWLHGNTSENNWITKPQKYTFFHLKGIIELLFERLGVDIYKLNQEYLNDDIFVEGLVFLFNDKQVVEMGIINPVLLKKFEIEDDVLFAEINWNLLVDLSKQNSIEFKELINFPEVRRDLSMILDKNITYIQIKNVAFETEKILLKRINLFDVYESEQIGKDKKSYALSLYLQDNTKTLTDNEIDDVMNRLMKAFEEKLGAQIRK